MRSPPSAVTLKIGIDELKVRSQVWQQSEISFAV